MISKVEVYIQYLLPDLLDYTELNSDKKSFSLRGVINIGSLSNLPIFIPYLLHDNCYINKDKNIHIKKLADCMSKAKEYIINYLNCPEDSITRNRIKEKFYNFIVQNSFYYVIANIESNNFKFLSKVNNNDISLRTLVTFDISSVKLGRVLLQKIMLKNIMHGDYTNQVENTLLDKVIIYNEDSNKLQKKL